MELFSISVSCSATDGFKYWKSVVSVQSNIIVVELVCQYVKNVQSYKFADFGSIETAHCDFEQGGVVLLMPGLLVIK